MILEGGERRAVRAHEFGDIRPDNGFLKQQFKRAQNRVITECPSLDNNTTPQRLDISQFEDLVESVSYHRVGQSGGDVRNGGPLTQGLLDPRIHEYRATSSQIKGRARLTSDIGKFRCGVSQ